METHGARAHQEHPLAQLTSDVFDRAASGRFECEDWRLSMDMQEPADLRKAYA
jgi:hypothetical protein